MKALPRYFSDGTINRNLVGGTEISEIFQGIGIGVPYFRDYSDT